MSFKVCFILLPATLAIFGCSPSRFIPRSEGENMGAPNLQAAIAYCERISEGYKSGIESLERADFLTKSGAILGGIGGVYEGVTGGSSRAITNFATSGTLLYAGQQFLVRRPTRVDIYNAGIRQINCILQNSPAGDTPDWLESLKTSAGHKPSTVSHMAFDYASRANALVAQIEQRQCSLPSSVEILKLKESDLADLVTQFQKAGQVLFSRCDTVTTQVSSAINKDSPSIDDIRVFLSGISIPSEDVSIDDQEGAPDAPSSTLHCDVGTHDELLNKSIELVTEIQTFLNFATSGISSENASCVAEIVPQILRLAGRSPYTIKKGDSESQLDIQVLGGVAPVSIQLQRASPDAPALTLDAQRNVITVKTTQNTSTGVYMFSAMDKSTSSVEFIVVIEE